MMTPLQQSLNRFKVAEGTKQQVAKAVPQALKDSVAALHTGFAQPKAVQNGQLTALHQPMGNEVATAAPVEFAPPPAPVGSGLTDERFNALSPAARSAVSPIQGDMPTISATKAPGLVATIDPSSGGVVWADPETATGTGLDRKTPGGFTGQEVALRATDQAAHQDFLNSPEAKAHASRVTSSALAPSFYAQESARRNSEAGRVKSDFNRATPDRGHGELSMADAVELAGGNRTLARSLVVQSRQDGNPASDTGNNEALAHYQALAKANGFDIPTNLAQGELVKLQVQKKQLGNIAEQRDAAASSIATIEQEALSVAANSANLGDVADKVAKFKKSNPSASTISVLEEIARAGDEDAISALQAIQASARALTQDPNSEYGARISGARQQVQYFDKIGSDLALQSGNAWQLSGAVAAKPTATTAGANDDDFVATSKKEAGIGERGTGGAALAANVSEATSLDQVIPELPGLEKKGGFINWVGSLFDDGLEAQARGEKQASLAGANMQEFDAWAARTEARIAQLPPEHQEEARVRAAQEAMAARGSVDFSHIIRTAQRLDPNSAAREAAAREAAGLGYLNH